MKTLTIVAVLLAACTTPMLDTTESHESTFACPAGTIDMLDWMTLDSDLRGSGGLVSATTPLYTRIDSDRFWWMKTDQGDTWDINTFDNDYIYFATTEQAFHAPWTCKPAVDTASWKAARRCVDLADPDSAIITNDHSTFEIMSSDEVEQTSGDQGTIFEVHDAGPMDWGALGVLPTLELDYSWNCWSGTCHQLEQYFLTQRYGLVRWRYSTDGVQQAITTFTSYASATVPAPMYGCTTPALTQRVSTPANHAAANGASYRPAIADDGRFIAYASSASNLVANDTNAVDDIFVYDNYWDVTATRASVASDGTQANGRSSAPAISRNGEARYIAFESDASNLVSNDTNGTTDIFVYDRWMHTTELVSTGPWGQGNGASHAPSISADGCRVAFHSKASNLVANDTNDGPGSFGTDVFVRDRCAATTERVSVSSNGAQGSNASWNASIDDSGRFVTYASGASELVPGGNGYQAIYLYDSYWKTTTRLSTTASGELANEASYEPQISGDSRYVAFFTSASNLGGTPEPGQLTVYVKDRWTGAVAFVGTGYEPTLSHDGRFVAYVAGTQAGWQPFIYDAWTSQLEAPASLAFAHAAAPYGIAISTHERSIAGQAIADRISLGYVDGNDVKLRAALVP